MSKGLNLLIVAAGLCINLYGLYGVRFGLPMPGYGGHFQFLSICGLVVATLSAIFRIINLLTGVFRGVYESLSAIATPVEGLITLLYWLIVIYDKKLLVPNDSTFDLPFVLDLCLHFFPTVVCWIDFLVFNKSFKRSKAHIFAIYAFTMIYFLWVNVCFEQNGYWPYPLLAQFTDMQRGAFFIVCGYGCSTIYKFIAKGHSYVHGKVENANTKKLQ